MKKKRLTSNQIWVIEELYRQDCPFVASCTKEHWERGEEYYIDPRVPVKGVRRKFNQGNKEAVGKLRENN